MVTPLARRRPQVLARQAASLAQPVRPGGSCSGLGLGDDWVREFSAYGDEESPRVRGAMLDDGLAVLTALLSGEQVDHAGPHYVARGVRHLPARPASRSGSRAASPTPYLCAGRPATTAFFVIGLDGPDDVDLGGRVRSPPSRPRPGFDLVIDLRTDQDHAPWLDSGATWVLTRIGPFDLDLAEVERTSTPAPGTDAQRRVGVLTVRRHSSDQTSHFSGSPHSQALRCLRSEGFTVHR